MYLSLFELIMESTLISTFLILPYRLVHILEQLGTALQSAGHKHPLKQLLIKRAWS